MAYGGRGGDIGGSSSGFWGRLQNEANTRLQQRTSRMEEVAREMARRQAEAEQRRREEEERRRQQEAERQRREAEQRAEEQKRQQEAESRMKLLEDQKRQREAQQERGKLVLAGLNHNDHENYRNAVEADPMLNQAKWERNMAVMTGDTRTAEEAGNWIRDREKTIRGNVIPATRTNKTMAEYQAEWNQDADRLAEERARKAAESRALQSREGLSAYTKAQDDEKRAQAEADKAKQWQADQSADDERVLAEARELALRMGYLEEDLPGTVEEMAALDPRIAENEQIHQYLSDKTFVKENAVRAKETADTAVQAVRDARNNAAVTAEDWGDLDRWQKDKWSGGVFNPLDEDLDAIRDQKGQITRGIRGGLYNGPQMETARKVQAELERREKMITDPKGTNEQIDQELAWLEGLGGAYWDERGSEIQERIRKLRRQKVLNDSVATGDENDFDAGAEAGYEAWRNAEGRTVGDRMSVGLTEGSMTEDARRLDVTGGGINGDWAERQANKLSDEGQKLLYLNDKELKRYYYYYNQSPERAAEYLDALDDYVHERRAGKREEEYQKEAEALPGLVDVASSVMEVAKPLTAVATLVQDAISGELHADDSAAMPDVYQRAVRGVRKEQLKDKPVASFLYDMATQVGDNLARAYGTMAMGITNSAVTTGMMAFGATGSTYRDLRQEGYSAEQAGLAAGIAGFAEYITEKWSDAEWFRGIQEGYTGFKNLMKSAIQSAGQEGWTEVASDLISLAGEKIALGDDNSYSQKIRDYYYDTGDMEEARKLAFQDQLGQELYTFALSALSGAGMEVANRSAAGIWKKYRDNKKKEVSGEAQSEQADTARDSYGTQDGAEAAAEGAIPQYSSEELDEALMAAAAPMTAQEQQTDDLMNGQQTADAVQAEADAQRAAEAVRVPAALQNDNVSRLAREIAAGEVAQGVEDMPVERRTEAPMGDYRQNDRVPAGVQAQQAEESVAGVEDMPVERREETPDVANRAAQLPHQGDGLKQIAANDRTKTVLAAWGLNDPDVEMDDDQAAKETWLAGIKGLMHEDTSEGIQDDNDWHDVAGSVWDEMMDQYGAELADRRNKLSLSLSKGAGILNEDGTVDGFSRINDPNMGLLQPAELAGIAGAVRDEYVRQQSVKAAAAARAANKYNFKTAAWDEDVEGAGRGVTLKTVDGELTAGQVTQLRLLDRFSRQLTAEGMPGMDIVVYDTIKRRGVKLNGSYDTKGGVKKAAIVNVALDAEGGNILRAAGHEMYHMIEQWGSNQATRIKDFVLKTLEGSQGYDLEGRREELREIYGEDADVDSEIVADSMFDVLNDEDRVSEVLKENRTLGDKIRDFTTRIFNALKAAGKKIAGMGSKEARALVDQTDTLDTIRGMFEEGVRTAQSNIMAARAAAGSEYNIDAVENAGTAQQRDNAITALVRKMVLNTQDETADANALQIQDLTGRMKNALMRFARGGASLDAALEEQGLKAINGEQERGVAAWLGRELIDRTEQTKKQAGGAVIGTADTVNEDEGTRESRVLYDDLGNPYYSTDSEQNWLMGALRTAKAQVGTWQRNLDALVERLTGTGSAKPGRIRQMLTNLYTAMDNAYKTGKGYENIMPYAKRIAETLGNKSNWQTNATTDIADYETEAYEALKGTVINLSDVLQPSQKQWKKNGELYRKTRYDWGDVSTYGTSATELNRNYGNVLKFKVDSKSANKGVAPSTILEENPSLALLVGYKSDEDNGNEANLLGRILDWIGNYERRAGVARGYYSNQVSNEAEDLILHYYDDQNSPEVQRLLEGMKGYRGMRDTEEQAIAAEVDILKQLTAVQADVINDLGTDVQRANRLKELADKRADRIQERFNVEKARRAIQKELTTMRQWLFEPTKADGRHVSDRFRSGIAAALQMVDTRGRHADSWRSVDYTQMIQAIQGEFGTIDGVEGNLVGEMIDPDLLPTLRNLEEKSKGKVLMEMNSQELNDLYQALSSITTMARNVDNARAASVKKKISTMAEDFIGNLQTQKDAPLRPNGIQKVTDFLSYNMMDPQRYFDNAERLGGETGRTIWNILRHDGLDTQIRLTEELKKIMAEKIGGFDYKTWASGNKQRVTTFDLSNGSQITLTDGAIMDLYNLNKRQQGRQHIYGINGHGGGIVMGRTQVGTKVYQTVQPVHVSVEDVNNIISALSDEQKKCADTLMEIVNQWGGKLGNEVSNALYGYSKFREDNYWTIHTIQDQHGVKGTDMEQASKADNLYAVLNMGMTKELNKFANNPVQLGNAFDVALDHLANMITYRSWGAPLMDVTRLMNYKSENGIVMREMNRTMGKAGSEYLVQLLRNINGLTNDPIEQKASAFTKMFKHFKAAAVGWNLSTIAKQGLSIVRAFDVVPSHYFLTARQLTERFKKDGEGKKVDGLMEKWAPIYSWKLDGRFTMDTGKDLRSIMLPKTETAVNRFTEVGMKGAGAADNMTWRSIWLATENMIERTTDLQRGTEEFYQAVGDKFTECIDRTQVVDSILHRAEIMRSNSQYVKLGTSFMGEPLKTWNMAADAIRAFAQNKNTVNGKRLIKTSFIMLASAALQATVASVISGLRHWSDDEPLEETIRKYLLGDYDESKGWFTNAIELLFGNNLANELNPINYIPYAREVSDIVQGHDVTRDDMESLSKLWKAFSNLANDSGKASDQKKIVEFVGAFADLVGVPASNIFKEIGYVSNWVSRALEQAGLDTKGIQYVNMQYDLEMGNENNLGSYAAFLDTVEKAVEEGRCEKEFAERVRADLIAAGYSEDTINERIGKRRIGDVSDATTKGGYYKDLVDAIRTGDKEKEDTIRKNLVLMGTTTKAIDDGVKDALAEEDDILKAAQAQVDARAGVPGQYKIYEDTVRKYDGQGFDHDTIIKAVNKAVNRIEDEGKKESSSTETKAGNEAAGTEKTGSVYGDSFGYEYKDLTNAVLNGLADVGEILEDLRKQDKKDQSIRTEVTKKVKPVWVDLMNSGDAEDRREADRIKQQLIDLGIGYDEKDLMRWLK